MDLILRLATIEDLPLLVQHRRAMFEEMGVYGARDLDAHDQAFTSWAEHLVMTGRLVAFLALAGGRAAASCCLWLREHQPRPGLETAHWPYLMSMFTEPEFRRRGAARALALAALQWARERGFTHVSLHATTPAVSLYERLGFTRTWEMRRNLLDEGPEV